MTPLHNGHAPTITGIDPADANADFLTDAANVAAIALRQESDAKVTCDDDVTVEAVGDEYVVTFPFVVVRLTRSQHREFADQLVKWALEEAGLRYMAASRTTEVVWRDMQRVAKS